MKSSKLNVQGSNALSLRVKSGREVKNLLNCWKLSSRQSAAKSIYLRIYMEFIERFNDQSQDVHLKNGKGK